MAHGGFMGHEPNAAEDRPSAMYRLSRKLFGARESQTPPSDVDGPRENHDPGQVHDPGPTPATTGTVAGHRDRSKKVVPELPRQLTFKRQLSESRTNMEPVDPTPAERRAVSADRRLHWPSAPANPPPPPSLAPPPQQPQTQSAPELVKNTVYLGTPPIPCSPPPNVDCEMQHYFDDIDPESRRPEVEELDILEHIPLNPHGPCFNEPPPSVADAQSVTTSQYDNMIHDELERVWILNLSMHYRDKSKREKFFVTYRERESIWRRVTLSLDYRNAPEGSLEQELVNNPSQRDKSAKIYEAIRASLADIRFFDTATNLKLQTSDGRLHVHVVEDVNEIIPYPTMNQIQHLGCRIIREHEIRFISHLSGFVYKVQVDGKVLIKKEIPGPDTVDEFLYEINALNRLRHSRHVISFYGVVVDDKEDRVRGLLISYADQGALVDVIYYQRDTLPWSTREKWARQIVRGLSEIHEAGFVQGDFTLSNIVIDCNHDAKIIDINRRGCPVGWEPPEAAPLIETNQRISMYIGVKSDLFQLGMVLWGLAMLEEEPESHARPLRIGPDAPVPRWFARIVEICLSDDPRKRRQAQQLLSYFPTRDHEPDPSHSTPPSDDGDLSPRDALPIQSLPQPARMPNTLQPSADWTYVTWSADGHPARGRSPPSPLPSDDGDDARTGVRRNSIWPTSAKSPGRRNVKAVASADQYDRWQSQERLRPDETNVGDEGAEAAPRREGLSKVEDAGDDAAKADDRGLESDQTVEKPILGLDAARIEEIEGKPFDIQGWLEATEDARSSTPCLSDTLAPDPDTDIIMALDPDDNDPAVESERVYKVWERSRSLKNRSSASEQDDYSETDDEAGFWETQPAGSSWRRSGTTVPAAQDNYSPELSSFDAPETTTTTTTTAKRHHPSPPTDKHGQAKINVSGSLGDARPVQDMKKTRVASEVPTVNRPKKTVGKIPCQPAKCAPSPPPRVPDQSKLALDMGRCDGDGAPLVGWPNTAANRTRFASNRAFDIPHDFSTIPTGPLPNFSAALRDSRDFFSLAPASTTRTDDICPSMRKYAHV